MKKNNLKTLISPSILNSDFANLEAEITSLDKAGADWIHIDVMDGHFVPNISFGADVFKAVRKSSDKTMDVHLMVDPVLAQIDNFAKAGADIITVHAETGHVHKSLQQIKDHGIRCGIALNPGTGIENILPVIDIVDLVLIMTVNPGFGGQKFIQSQLVKIQKAREIIDNEMINNTGRKIDLQVDGGINFETAKLAVEHGANVLVAGTAVLKGGKEMYSSNINKLRINGN